MAPSELGEYLRARRARLRPDEVNLPSHGPRRVPGLRREEIALLAGVTCLLCTPHTSAWFSQVENNMTPDGAGLISSHLCVGLHLTSDFDRGAQQTLTVLPR